MQKKELGTSWQNGPCTEASLGILGRSGATTSSLVCQSYTPRGRCKGAVLRLKSDLSTLKIQQKNQAFLHAPSSNPFWVGLLILDETSLTTLIHESKESEFIPLSSESLFYGSFYISFPNRGLSLLYPNCPKPLDSSTQRINDLYKHLHTSVATHSSHLPTGWKFHLLFTTERVSWIPLISSTLDSILPRILLYLFHQALAHT